MGQSHNFSQNPVMNMKLLTSLSLAAGILAINSCGKPNTPPPPTASGKCFLVSETVNGGPGYGASWVYKYDADGHLLSGSNPPVNGQTPDGALAVNGNLVGIGFGKLKWLYGYVGDLKNGIPSSGYMDFTDDGTTNPKFEEYIFGYDGKQRLIEVAIKAGTINIAYDDKDNVVKLTFITNNGPRVISPIVTIDGYDDKPTPYAADPKIWIFTQQMRSWSYFDEYRIISALSKNNPGRISTDYGVGNTASNYVYDIFYQYNDNGMPALATVQRTYRGAKTTWQSNSYGYDCK